LDSIERAAQKLAERQKAQALRDVPSSERVAETGPTAPTGLLDKEPAPARPAASVGDHKERAPAATAPTPMATGPSPRGSVIEIDTQRLGRLGFVSPDQPVTRVAEEFRVLKHRVLHNAFSAEWESETSPRLIMVTSAQPREGKSFTAVNLALSIASERDTRVLLVDGDFLNPSVFKSLHLPRPPRGFIDVLEDEKRGLESVILPTNINHLTLADAGRSNDLASEYLASQRMQRICAELTERYEDRIVIFDSSPVLASSEPSVLTHHVGQILFVVEARRSTHGTVRAGLEMIHDTSKVMMVLNKSRLLAGGEAFGGYYDYYRNSKR
jgi:exopolysaccharide/PEP-CTERM locus tyrosine autokinase